jgi:hypothetical protein
MSRQARIHPVSAQFGSSRKEHDMRISVEHRFKEWTTALALMVIGAVHPCAAIAAPCPLLAAPNVVLDVNGEEVREVFDTSEAELDQLAVAAGATEQLPVFSRYTSNLGYRVDFDVHVEQADYDKFCAAPKAVHIVVLLADRIIHRAQETQEDPCLLEAMRAHQLRHARAEQRALDERAPMLLEQLRKAMAQLQIEEAQSPPAARSQVVAAAAKQIAAQFGKLEDYRRELIASVDTSTEIERVHAACTARNSHAL